jgi:hypothetical protein
MEIIRIKISPEFLQSDIVEVTSSGYTFGVYTGLTSLLQGNSGGTSLLTGLTFPILLKQKYQDIGYYDGFDGNITQQVISANFSFTSSTENPYTFSLFNNSSEGAVYLIDSTYTIDWGDGSSQIINSFYPDFINHTYVGPLANTTSYTITLKQENMWGTVTTTKTINVPYSLVDNSNPLGTVTFANTSGSWSASPQTYNFIYTADSYNEIAYQIGSYYSQVPYFITGVTTSRLEDLSLYGPTQYQVGQTVNLPGGGYGVVNYLTSQQTGYTINNTDYIDFLGGTSIFVVASSGLTSSMLVQSAITKNEVLMNVIDQPQLFSSVFVERGKNSALENFRRIGEVSTMSNLVNYGYNFFNIQNSQ